MVANGWLSQDDSMHSLLASCLSITCSRHLHEGILQTICLEVSSGPTSVDSSHQHLLLGSSGLAKMYSFYEYSVGTS
jgi:hypothetical protein